MRNNFYRERPIPNTTDTDDNNTYRSYQYFFRHITHHLQIFVMIFQIKNELFMLCLRRKQKSVAIGKYQ